MFRIFGFDLPGIRGSVYNLFSTSLTTCLYYVETMLKSPTVTPNGLEELEDTTLRELKG